MRDAAGRAGADLEPDLERNLFFYTNWRRTVIILSHVNIYTFVVMLDNTLEFATVLRGIIQYKLWIHNEF